MPGMPVELDFAAGADHAMPGNRAVRGAEGPGDLPGVLGKSGGAGYLAVGRDLAAGNFPDGREEIAECEGPAGHATGAAS